MSHNQNYTAAVIVIGNEILSGRTQDTNTAYIAKTLSGRGVRLMEVRVIPDVAETIIATVNALRPAYDYVFTTGGIGPTHDDITAESIAGAFDVALERNAQAYAILEAYYGRDQLTDARLRMARIPAGSSLIPNPVSAAPGFQIGNVYVFAGVPKIMQAMMDHVAAHLRGGDPVLSASVSCALAESAVAEEVAALQDQYADDVEIGSYPQFGGIAPALSIVLRSTRRDILETATQALVVLMEKRGVEPQLSYSWE